MFERLIRNNVEYSQLKRQRRMTPEIRRALTPIYPDLEDHASVSQRPPIAGMGGVNTWFFTHKGRETNDTQSSKTNPDEADMVVGLFNYLRQNGNDPAKITVLTFYNGQRKLILRKLREHPNMFGGRFKVVTVDSYQGEENDIVILSLVRSNVACNIGFLTVENRVCVAISRAQRGFYIFGDGLNLCKSSILWWEVIQILAKPRRVGFHLPLTCRKHGNMTFVQNAGVFEALKGGCTLPCREELPCGHACPVGKCHPLQHDLIECHKRCSRVLQCGHPCAMACFADCKAECDCEVRSDAEDREMRLAMHYAKAVAGPPMQPSREIAIETTASTKTMPKASGLSENEKPTQHGGHGSMEAFNDYAMGGHLGHDRSLANIAEQQANEARLKRLDEENAAALFGLPNSSNRAAPASKVDLVRTQENAKSGVRNVWAETYMAPPRPQKGHKKQNSLLD